MVGFTSSFEKAFFFKTNLYTELPYVKLKRNDRIDVFQSSWELVSKSFLFRVLKWIILTKSQFFRNLSVFFLGKTSFYNSASLYLSSNFLIVLLGNVSSKSFAIFWSLGPQLIEYPLENTFLVSAVLTKSPIFLFDFCFFDWSFKKL